MSLTTSLLLPVIEADKYLSELFTEFLCDISEYLDGSLGVKLGSMVIMYLLFADDIVLFFGYSRRTTETDLIILGLL